MATLLQAKNFYRFGPFRLDAVNRVLWRDSGLVPLPPKVVDTLLVLVENAGAPISKEDLMAAVWPDTFVEEGNLTHNISVLRKTLGDASPQTGYIETIPKRGYRFVGRVEGSSNSRTATALNQPATVTAISSLQPLPVRRGLPGSRAAALWALIPLAAVAVILLMLVVPRSGWFARTVGVSEPVYRQITANPAHDPVFRAAISPDGELLAYSDLKGIYLRRVDTGETRSFAAPPGLCFR